MPCEGHFNFTTASTFACVPLSWSSLSLSKCKINSISITQFRVKCLWSLRLNSLRKPSLPLTVLLSECVNTSELIISGCVNNSLCLRDSQGSHQLKNSILDSAVISQTTEEMSGTTETQTCTRTGRGFNSLVDWNVCYIQVSINDLLWVYILKFFWR